jgi:hypothetical protein
MNKLLWMIVGAIGATARGKLSENGGLTCIFGHKWNGCTCKKCGTVRDEHHRMVSVPGECVQQCAICGKTGRTEHKYRRDPGTGDYICVICGINKGIEDRKKFTALKVLLGLGGLSLLLLLLLPMMEHMVLLIGLIVILILFGTMVMVLRHLRLKRQQDIDFLNADVSKIGDDEATRRAEKYQDR